jgi:hypothetical protein
VKVNDVLRAEVKPLCQLLLVVSPDLVIRIIVRWLLLNIDMFWLESLFLSLGCTDTRFQISSVRLIFVENGCRGYVGHQFPKVNQLFHK